MTTLTLNGNTIHSLAELREQFDLPEVTAAFLNGTLEEWLADCYYEREAEAVSQLEQVLNPATEERLCRILGVEYTQGEQLTPEQQAIYERKCAVIRQHTQDPELLSHVMETATNQAELAELLNAGHKTIYLCGGSFTIPIRKSGVHYIGIGSPKMDTPFTEEQYRRAGVTFSGVALPSAENEAIDDIAKALAGDAARENGYDDFAEKHNRLAVLFHTTMKGFRVSNHCHLDTDASIAYSEFYKSKFAAEQAAHGVVNQAYDEANSFIRPGCAKCVANETASQYGAFVQESQKIADRLKPYCDSKGELKARLAELVKLVRNARQNLQDQFEEELRGSTDYYQMYQRSYFLEKIDIEKDDYNLDLFDSDLLNGLARLICDNSEYTIEHLYETVSELEEDVNQHADTFFGAAYQIFREYCGEIENIAEEIGKNLSDDDLVKLGLA